MSNSNLTFFLIFSRFLLIFGILQRFLCNPMKFRQNLVKFQRNLERKLSKFDIFVEKLRKNCKIYDEHLLNFSGRSGAKECKSCRVQKMLQNAAFLAIVAVDTDENEPSKVSMKWGSQTGVAPVISLRLFETLQKNEHI